MYFFRFVDSVFYGKLVLFHCMCSFSCEVVLCCWSGIAGSLHFLFHCISVVCRYGVIYAYYIPTMQHTVPVHFDYTYVFCLMCVIAGLAVNLFAFAWEVWQRGEEGRIEIGVIWVPLACFFFVFFCPSIFLSVEYGFLMMRFSQPHPSAYVDLVHKQWFFSNWSMLAQWGLTNKYVHVL